MGMMGAALAEADKVFDWAVTKRLLGYLSPYGRNVRIALGGALLTVLGYIAGPPLIGFAVDEGILKGNLHYVLLGVITYLLLDGAAQIGFRVQVMNMSFAGQRIIQKLRDELFSHIQRLSLSFFSSYETGKLIARVIGDVNVLREAITFAVVGAVRDILILFGIVIAMLFISLPLTMIALVVVAVVTIMANYWRIYARKAYNLQRETNSANNAELSEAFNAIRVTQAYARQGQNYRRFAEQINHAHLKSSLRAAWVASLFFPGIELVGGVALGALVYVGGSLVLDQTISVATLLTFVLYIEQLFFPIRMLAQRYNIFQAVMAAGGKIFTLMDTPLDIQDAPDAVELPTIQGHVRFEDVSFAYPPMKVSERYGQNGKHSKNGKHGASNGSNGQNHDHSGSLSDNSTPPAVLKHVTLDVPHGYTVALVGHTGAGKTSIVKLLSRFYEVSEGRITIDGYDIRKVTQESLRRQMGVVVQETHLFSGTVMDNIRYGRLDASDEEVIEAAKAVGADAFISKLENGYYTEVREGGAILSAGQKQLISFARALLADPRILILDEATSSIDTQTEKVIQDALKRLLKGRTSFVIAHRLSTITSADLIVVMDHGMIVEQGSHQALLAQGGAYRDLYTMAYARPLEATSLHHSAN
ncbi:MAG: ABC transporter ATP-binding protein [Chloroflexi bacterium CFX4]|nr:ABC transporter ATP-binding protein [Chloroflexi bacterium CFX4]MDL1923229.1 ABC transporter ATP-binding protein [Chloroflexi bacterium CFX3]